MIQISNEQYVALNHAADRYFVERVVTARCGEDVWREMPQSSRSVLERALARGREQAMQTEYQLAVYLSAVIQLGADFSLRDASAAEILGNSLMTPLARARALEAHLTRLLESSTSELPSK